MQALDMVYAIGIGVPVLHLLGYQQLRPVCIGRSFRLRWQKLRESTWAVCTI